MLHESAFATLGDPGVGVSSGRRKPERTTHVLSASYERIGAAVRRS